MKKINLKKLFLEERPALNNYLVKIDFSLNQVISIESCTVESCAWNGQALVGLTHRFVFRGMGFVFYVDTNEDYSFFKPTLKFNEIQVESQAG